MTFQKTWTGIRQQEPPNKLRTNPIISLRLNLHPSTLTYLNDKKNQHERSKYILQAIERSFFMDTNKRVFLEQILEENYHLCRHLLRKIGRRKC